MAITTEIDTQSPVLVPPVKPKRAHVRTGKKPTGRPRDPEPEEIDEDDTVVEQVDDMADADSEWQTHNKNLTEDEWARRVVYCIRLSPTTEKRSGGRAIPVCSYVRPFDLEDLKKEHGSGVYRLDYLILTQPSGRYRRYRQEKIDIVDPKYPPNLPYGEWIERPENEAWKWAGPALLAKQQEEAAKVGAPMPVVNGAGGAYPPGLNFNELLLKVTEANDPKKLAEFLKMIAPAPKDDTVITTLLTTLLNKSLAPPPVPDNSAMERIFKMQDETLKELRQEIRELRNKESTPQKSIIEQFVELRPQIKELVDAFATKAGKTDIWAEIAKEGISQIPDALSLIRDAIKKPDQSQPNGHQQPRGIAAAPPATVTTAATPEPATKPVDQMSEDEKAKMVDGLWRKWARRLLDISTKLIEEFTIQDQGYSFRDWYVEMYGKLNWAELRRDLAGIDQEGNIHPELVTNMYFAHEQLRKALSPPERLTAFLVEFFTNFGEEKGVTVEGEEGAVDPTEVIPAQKSKEAKTK